MANVSELKQVNVALSAFGTGVNRKPMSEEAKQKIREAQLRRHQPDATSNAASNME